MTSQRADYYGALQANAALFKLAEKIDVPPLDADKLALVLHEPARVLGVGFESDDLISQVVKSAEDQPGALPLLADLFTDLWERMRERGDDTLRVSDRREIIQVGAALSKRADAFFAKHPDKVEAVKRLFTLRLAHVPRHGEPVRARWEWDTRGNQGQEIDAEWALVELLAEPDWRLVVTGEKDGKAAAEVAHEILLKTWPALKRWLEDEREFLVWRGEIKARQEEYDNAGKGGARQQRQALLMGLSLARFRSSKITSRFVRIRSPTGIGNRSIIPFACRNSSCTFRSSTHRCSSSSVNNAAVRACVMRIPFYRREQRCPIPRIPPGGYCA